MTKFIAPIYILLLFLLGSYLLGFTPLLISLMYLLASLVSFFLYYKDKRAAQKGEWRIPETTLHLSSLLCGWPGSIFAQHLLRHKTQKVSFRITFWAMLLINILGLGYIHSPQGSQALYKSANVFEHWIQGQFDNTLGRKILLHLIHFRGNT